MSHKHGRIQHPLFRTREAGPSMRSTPEGVQILCPFCKPTHPLIPGQAGNCGTVLRLTAIQDILPHRIVRMQNIKCLKCHQGGGEMVQYMNGFIHLQDCDPKIQLLPTIPNYSRFANLVYKMPKGAQRFVERFTGHAQQVREIDNEGHETGKIMGYFFRKTGGMVNG